MKKTIITAVALALGAIACSSAPDGTERQQAPGTQAVEAKAPALTPSAIKLSTKVVSKDCFGSAGCSVQYRVEPKWPAELVADDEEYELVYEVSGVEDGPQIGKLVLMADGQYASSDEFAMIPKSSTKLKVKINSLEKR